MAGEQANKGVYRIDEVARRVGLSHKRIHEYEKSGLIAPAREPRTNNRLFSDLDVERILRIKALIHEHGLTLACLRVFLSSAPCWIVFGCTRKQTCPAYGDPHSACYEVLRLREPQSLVKCEKCPVYLNRTAELFSLLPI
ncbi:MAG: MerR family transcriptional regulator [Desulfobacterales bacterium]|nr:MerR family transcriptional regulator [Desulfobacterales bacterium]